MSLDLEQSSEPVLEKTATEQTEPNNYTIEVELQIMHSDSMHGTCRAELIFNDGQLSTITWDSDTMGSSQEISHLNGDNFPANFVRLITAMGQLAGGQSFNISTGSSYPGHLGGLAQRQVGYVSAGGQNEPRIYGPSGRL